MHLLKRSGLFLSGRWGQAFDTILDPVDLLERITMKGITSKAFESKRSYKKRVIKKFGEHPICFIKGVDFSEFGTQESLKDILKTVLNDSEECRVDFVNFCSILITDEPSARSVLMHYSNRQIAYAVGETQDQVFQAFYGKKGKEFHYYCNRCGMNVDVDYDGDCVECGSSNVEVLDSLVTSPEVSSTGTVNFVTLNNLLTKIKKEFKVDLFPTRDIWRRDKYEQGLEDSILKRLQRYEESKQDFTLFKAEVITL